MASQEEKGELESRSCINTCIESRVSLRRVQASQEEKKELESRSCITPALELHIFQQCR